MNITPCAAGFGKPIRQSIVEHGDHWQDLLPSLRNASPNLVCAVQSYPKLIQSTLIPAKNPKWLAVDLFAGCGGLALGFEAAGFATIGFEKDRDACETYRQNLAGKCVETTLTPDSDLPDCDIVIGGPPCQPFSVGGLQSGLHDSRDGFPTFISAVKRLRF